MEKAVFGIYGYLLYSDNRNICCERIFICDKYYKSIGRLREKYSLGCPCNMDIELNQYSNILHSVSSADIETVINNKYEYGNEKIYAYHLAAAIAELF